VGTSGCDELAVVHRVLRMAMLNSVRCCIGSQWSCHSRDVLPLAGASDEACMWKHLEHREDVEPGSLNSDS